MSTGKADRRVAIEIAPTIFRDSIARRLLYRIARDLGAESTLDAEGIVRVRDSIEERTQEVAPYWRPAFRLCASILCDLRGQGWVITVERNRVTAFPPGVIGTSQLERKEQIRASHLIERDAQLVMPATRVFIREMEQRRLFNGDWHSIFSLMRDGRELAADLRNLASDDVNSLRKLVDPYVQPVETEARCEFTGLRLSDIWRYFRHTWTITHNSTPGRRLNFLVRDRAAPFHPVIGIGALASAIIQLGPRDEWIGWTSSSFLERLDAEPSRQWARWLVDNLDRLVDNLEVADFIDAKVIQKQDLAVPTESVIRKLRFYAKKQRHGHRLYPSQAIHKSKLISERDPASWITLAETSLFRAKRADTLASLLEARYNLHRIGFNKPTAERLRAVLRSPVGRKAIQVVLRQVKGARIGVEMMDITVCGAIAPYNALLGGKLVALLMASPIVTETYADRYKDTPSIIASAMAGRRIVRRPRLVALGTTSLYHVAPSQYNRIKVPAHLVGGNTTDVLQYIKLGITEGVGSFHFSRDTMRAVEVVLARGHHGRRVNSIFGEGVNPKLRKVREALAAVGLPADQLLIHGSPRVVYGIPLASNFRDVLLGRAKRAKLIMPPTMSTTDRLIDFWLSRWLRDRIKRPEVLEAVSAHNKSYPIIHGARVPLPVVSAEAGPLFSVADSLIGI